MTEENGTQKDNNKMTGRHIVRHAAYGAAFGLLFPVLATIYALDSKGMGFDWASFVQVQGDQPLLWVIDTAPLFLGLFATIAGINKEQQEVLKITTRQLMDSGARLQLHNRTLREIAKYESIGKSDVQEALSNVISAAAQTLNIDLAGICMLDDDQAEKDRMECIIMYSGDRCYKPEGGASFDGPDMPLLFEVINSGNPMNIADVEKTNREVMCFASATDGAPRALLAVPIKIEGEPVGVFSCASTNGPRVWQQDEQNFAEAIANFIALVIVGHKRHAAEESSRAKSEFLAMISHELRTPLNAISGFSELIVNEDTSPQIQEYAGHVKKGSDILLVLINDILDLSKLERGNIRLEMSQFRVREALADGAEVFRPQINEKGLQFNIEVADDVPERVYGDKIRLRQILLNLMSNALKFTEEGGITLRARMERMIDTENALFYFELEDTGIGIESEHHDKIFDLFTQADSSKARNFNGTGLGLTICKRLVELMEGNIGVRSEPDKGSTFWFTAVMKVPPKKKRSASRGSDDYSLQGEELQTQPTNSA